MTASILVATPHAPFGELLRISLEEEGLYRVYCASTPAEARAAAEARSAPGQEPFALAILDSSLPGEPFAPLCAALLRVQPNMRLVVIPPENNPNHPALGGLMPHGYLSRPFYLPNLMQLVARLAGADAPSPETAAPPVSEPPAPAWSIDPAALARALEQEIAASDALAGVAVSISPGVSGTARAMAGALDAEGANELAGLVARCWNRSGANDLLRFARLSAGKRDYLVYITQILPGLALALAFDTAAPLSRIRPRARAAAEALARACAPNEPAPQPPAAATPEPPQRAPAIAINGGAGEMLAALQADGAINGGPAALPESAALPQAVALPLIASEYTRLAELPQPPAPLRGSAADEPRTQPIQEEPPALASAANLSGGEDAEVSEDDEKLAINLAALLGAFPPPDPETRAFTRRPAAEAAGEMGNGWLRADAALTEPLPRAPIPPDPVIDPLEDTQPRFIHAAPGLDSTPLPPLAMLHYTCVLLPRDPAHHLIGELAEAISQWVGQLCAGLGWRLEGIAVRPEYLQWSAQIPPSVSPGSMVRALRQRTSLNIFAAYPRLAEGNPTGDFWSTGYLVVSGPQPPSAQLLHDYIRQARRRLAQSA